MPFCFCCLLLLSLFAPVWARTAPQPGDAASAGPVVSVCLETGTNADPSIVALGRVTANSLFDEVGIKLRWTCPDEYGAITEPDVEQEITVRLTGNTPADVNPGALGYAYPYAREGVRVTVFYDRIGLSLHDCPLTAGAVLGYVFAHEIGHVLMGVASHREYGVMRARWDSRDWRALRAHALAFAPEDADLMNHNLRRRAARAAHLDRPLARAAQ